MRAFLASLLIFAYLFALVMSTGHLAEWYRLSLGSLPRWFAIGLAASLETSAFLLSLLSNSLLRYSRWANYGSLVALGLVWVGNFFSMWRAAPNLPLYEIFLSSLFVPVSTYVVAKVLGELLAHQPKPTPSQDASIRSLLVHPQEGEETFQPTQRKLPQNPLPFPPSSPEPLPPSRGEGKEEGNERKEDKGELPRYRSSSYQQVLSFLDSPRTATELMSLTGLSRSRTYKILDTLRKEGLVEKHGETWHRMDREGERVG